MSRWPEAKGWPVLTLEELMALPPAERVLASSLSRRVLEMELGDAPGAWPKGTRVRKRNSAPDDYHKNGTLGTVHASLAVPQRVRDRIREATGRECGFFYLLVWDGMAIPVLVPDDRLEVTDE